MFVCLQSYISQGANMYYLPNSNVSSQVVSLRICPFTNTPAHHFIHLQPRKHHQIENNSGQFNGSHNKQRSYSNYYELTIICNILSSLGPPGKKPAFSSLYICTCKHFEYVKILRDLRSCISFLNIENLPFWHRCNTESDSLKRVSYRFVDNVSL